MTLLRIFLVLSVALGSGCIRYEPYKKKDRNRSAETCSEAVDAYVQNIESMVENRCVACHTLGGSGALVAAFQRGKTEWNMAVFSKLKQGDAQAIYDMASSNEKHGGKQQLFPEDLDKLKAFFSAVSQCSTPLSNGSSTTLCDGKPLPRRVSLLSRVEYRNTVQHITGVAVDVNIPAASSFEDANKNPRLAFSNDQKSRAIDSNLAFNIRQAALTIAKGFDGSKRDALGCRTEPLTDACLQKLGSQVYRRPLTPEETAELKTLGNFNDVVTLLFQSPHFLYRTEVGSALSGETMTSYEIAAALSYLLTSRPPDAVLTSLAAQGALNDPRTRRAQAERLMDGGNATSETLQKFFIEWLELGRSETADKVGTYDGKAVFAETQAFLNQILKDGGNLEALLTQTEGGRLGILQQKAFLASHSNHNSTAPVKIGKTVARQMLCLPLPLPPANVANELGDTPDLKTTRSKLAKHTSNPSCASCHARIDPFGLAFENFDQLGMNRTIDNGEPVDTRVEVALGSSIDRTYKNSDELIQSISQSQELTACFDSFFQQFAYGTVSCEAQALSPTTSFRDYILNLISSDRYIQRI